MFDTLQEKITIVIVSGERNIIDYIKTHKYIQTHKHIQTQKRIKTHKNIQQTQLCRKNNNNTNKKNKYA